MNAVTSMIPRVQPYNSTASATNMIPKVQPMNTVKNMINPVSNVSNMYAYNQPAPYIPDYTLNWGAGALGNPLANLKTNFGLNPGLIQPVPIQTTNPTVNQFNWGSAPFQPSTTFNSQLSKQIPTAPATVKPTSKVTITKPAVVKR